MENDKFIAKSAISKEILNSAMILKTLTVNALIIGDTGTGKKILAKTIVPNAQIFNANELQNDIHDNVLTLNNETIILDRIEDITDVNSLIEWASSNQIRVLATSLKNNLSQKIKDFFAITLTIPPLEKRKEDIKPLADKFVAEASSILTDAKTKPEKLIINISKNAHSLRKSIYFSFLFESIGENEIMMLLEKYFYDNMDGNNNYRDFIYLYEAPLLKASQKKYKSQLQMSKHLGLNRITLRKKLEQHKELF